MNKQTKTLLTVGALGAVAYYFWKQQQGSPETPAEAIASATTTAQSIVNQLVNPENAIPGLQY